MRLVSLCVVFALVGASLPSGAQAALEHYDLNIPREPLDQALKEFARQTGLEVVRFSDVTRGAGDAGPIVGSFTRDDALGSLLASSGLKVRVLNARTVAIVREQGGSARSLSESGTDAMSSQATVDNADNDPQKAQGSFSGRFRVAQADQGQTTVEKEKSDSSPQNEKAQPITLEEVIVTATKRAVDVQKLPESVTAITSERLDELNAVNFDDYFRTVPGLMTYRSGTGQFDFSLRGVVSNVSTSLPSTSATVSQYIDEIPITAVEEQLDPRLVDIERVEVLRGPQGTFFGEGSLGGTIRQITKKPDLESFSATVEERLGDTYNSHGGTDDSESAMINVPLITDKLGFRANFYDAFDSGFIDLLDPAKTGIAQQDINPDHSQGGRAMLLFTPAERISILGEAFTFTSLDENNPIYQPSAGDWNMVQGPGQPACSGPPLCPAPTPGTPASYAYQKIHRFGDLYNVTVTVNFDAVSLVSSSSVADITTNRYFGSTYDPTDPFLLDHAKSLVQEVRLVSSPEWSKRVDYVIGAYYLDKREASEDFVPTALHNNILYLDKAIFGEGGYAFTDHLNARIGLRQENARNDGPESNEVLPSTTVLTSTVSEASSPTTGRAVLNYNVNQDAMVYTSFSTGFRNGGVNQDAVGRPGVLVTYKPDHTTNYEFGWKLSFPEQRVTLNGAFYHIDWRDIQVASFVNVPAGPGVPGTVNGLESIEYVSNAGKAKVDGFELESGLELLEGLRANASLSLIDARLAENAPESSYQEETGTCPVGACSGLKGDALPLVARVSGSASLNYSRPLPSSGFRGFIDLNEAYTGPRNNGFKGTGDTGSTFATMPGYWSSNWQLGVSDPRWRVSLYVNNVFNTRIQEIDLSTLGIVTDTPRTIGLSIRCSID